MANPTGKNQYDGTKGHPKHTAPKVGNPAPKKAKPKNQVTVLGGRWTGPMNNRVFVPNGKTSKVRGPSKYG